MAEPIIDAKEAEFRSKSQSHSFAAKAWGGLAGASFFGALITLANALVAVAAAVSTTGGAANPMLAASSAMLNPLPLAVLGGMAAFGLVATYMSNRSETELKLLNDEHQAQVNAKCMEQSKSRGVAQQQEYEQNCRSDGKSWANAVAANQNHALAAGRRTHHSRDVVNPFERKYIGPHTDTGTEWTSNN